MPAAPVLHCGLKDSQYQFEIPVLVTMRAITPLVDAR